MMSYKPSPIDTTDVSLSDELQALTELLAKNTHELWAKKRIDEGWTYGPVRNDERKEHPGLVPYEDLSESEKDYDRTTAMETLKTVSAMGYKIEKV